MAHPFKPECRAALIGSLPLKDHTEALEMVWGHTPDIPLWVQLPAYDHEKMVPQFLAGLPGVVYQPDGFYVDASDPQFDRELLSFYEDYMAVSEGEQPLEESRFALDNRSAPGFFHFLDKMSKVKSPPAALKGQITGPFTFTTGVYDKDGMAIHYDEQINDAAVKLLSLKAMWQVRKLADFERPVMVFIDEPALAGFGTSEFLSVSKADVITHLNEVIGAIHSLGALAGIHVCANTDWSLVFESAADIVSFDAYSYFDRFVLFAELIQGFIKRGGIIAWGIVPTGDPEQIREETSDSLSGQLTEKMKDIEAMGIEADALKSQSLITPSCGTGSLPIESAQRVLQLTAEVSKIFRQ